MEMRISRDGLDHILDAVEIQPESAQAGICLR
jgi:hypothetical protein